jgi:hypothetical protein
VAPGWLNPYMVGHYRLDVADDGFNGLEYVLSCRPARLCMVKCMAPSCRVIWHYSGASQVVNRAGGGTVAVL